MASILNFPGIAETPKTLTSPSAEEAALNRPRRGLHLVGSSALPTHSLQSGNQLASPAVQVDLEIVRRSTTSRLRRLFSPSDYTDSWPLGAA